MKAQKQTSRWRKPKIKRRRPQSPLCRNPNFLPRGASPAPAPMAPASSGRPEEEEEHIFQQPQEEESYWEIPRSSERLEQEEGEKQPFPARSGTASASAVPRSRPLTAPEPVRVLTIKPQDIGLLPRETWTYGNNSFLLHGYYNYRYLILAQIEDGKRDALHPGGAGPLLQQ